MIYFLYGSDTRTSREKLHELVQSLQKKKPDAEVFRLTAGEWRSSQLEELVSSRGLFEAKYIIILDHLFEKKDIKEEILRHLEDAKNSEHVFLLLEGKVDAASVKQVTKAAVKSQEFIDPSAENKKPSFSIFSITDALTAKDRKKLWITYRDVLAKGAAPEEIHGVLFWQVKNMLLVSIAENQKESGLSPFAYKNAMVGLRSWKKEELSDISARLIEMTHRVRQGEGELEIMLEKVLLEV